MDGPTNTADGHRRVLLAVAAPREAQAVLRGLGVAGRRAEPWRITLVDDRFDLVLTGVGKANAAGAVAHALDPSRHRAVVNLGVAGALPGSGLDMCEVVLATSSVFADEGVLVPEGYQDMASLGFAPTPQAAMGVDATPWLASLLSACADAAGPIATVSMCSGTDALAAEIVSRTNAIAEAMEGAAVGLAVAWRRRIAWADDVDMDTEAQDNADLAYAELRVISNTTGRRDRQRWALSKALDRLTTLAASLSALYWDHSGSA